MSEGQKKNHLESEPSPYLQQHVHNPVNWYPWEDEAFQKAREENRPIFLSIGYSTCHWCHVMAHESFEDEEVAKLMNETFVSIKVDREERPDIDGVYMQVAQMMTRRAGWPLTIIMTPDKEPFFAATYIPKETRFNTMGMMDLCRRIKELWESDQANIRQVIERVKGVLSNDEVVYHGVDMSTKDQLDLGAVDSAVKQLEGRFDEKKGGFGTPPKFPSPQNLLLLMRHWKRTKEERSLEMVLKTLVEMRRGGVYDQVGYGFHRYSTDDEWLLPHFEKMLYDQAGLMMAYTEAFQITQNGLFSDTVQEIAEYVLRDMTAPEGAFYSAENADSEGVEGKFYVWSQKEIQDILSQREAAIFGKVYGIERNGNFRDEATGEETGLNIPHMRFDSEDVAKEMSMEPSQVQQILDSAREKLFDAREHRVRPSRDDKILADWNGYMIAALAKAGTVINDSALVEKAEKAIEYVLSELKDKSNHLLHSLKRKNEGIPGFLDDYAFVIWGLIELYEATFKSDYLSEAKVLMDTLFEKFWDSEKGGFFFTAHDSEELLTRRKDIYDGAMPSGNSTALYNMIRLARLLGEPDLEQKAADMVGAFSSEIARMYSAHSMMLVGLDFALGKSYEVVLAGKKGDELLEDMVKEIRRRFIPNKVVLLRASEEQSKEITRLAPYTEFHNPVRGKATAHVCVDHNCRLPTNELSQMLEFLDEK
jgi:hypothetical protein